MFLCIFHFKIYTLKSIDKQLLKKYSLVGSTAWLDVILQGKCLLHHCAFHVTTVLFYLTKHKNKTLTNIVKTFTCIRMLIMNNLTNNI